MEELPPRRHREARPVIEALLVLAGAVPGFFAGGSFVFWRKRHRVPKHRHDWGEWEDSTISYPRDRTASAQRRRCITCKFKEVRRVIDNEY